MRTLQALAFFRCKAEVFVDWCQLTCAKNRFNIPLILARSGGGERKPNPPVSSSRYPATMGFHWIGS
ncbi:hypothetical protein scyTo_0010443 [Scyliorhinus torazame]|uniref:Uncharacterized protein n=1 Tax=Scyliorhinus torazame TaxID=75743 RepID=A0A401P6E5_SCYTO|nr:hypothetical protein [Scyliorhinus torazame]